MIKSVFGDDDNEGIDMQNEDYEDLKLMPIKGIVPIMQRFRKPFFRIHAQQEHITGG